MDMSGKHFQINRTPQLFRTQALSRVIIALNKRSHRVPTAYTIMILKHKKHFYRIKTPTPVLFIKFIIQINTRPTQKFSLLKRIIWEDLHSGHLDTKPEQS